MVSSNSPPWPARAGVCHFVRIPIYRVFYSYLFFNYLIIPIHIYLFLICIVMYLFVFILVYYPSYSI
eukprot:SAG25_NODE_75_length_16951_cov_86.523208_19_plen_67_part_00